MKSSTLHRSGLTKERMVMLENVKPGNLQDNEVPQYHEADKTVSKLNELDVLYKGVEKSFSHAKTSISKTPGVYLVIGFIAGAMFMLLVAGIVALSSGSSTQGSKGPAQGVKVIETTTSEENGSPSATEEKYTVKKGDTLDKIVYKIYGKYDNLKIEEIQTRNNITNPSRLQVGQVIVIPVPQNNN
jgi:hypothetical protein